VIEEGEPEEPVSGSRIRDYELLNEVAHGGMGIVYRARQLVPPRIVALKMILPSNVGSAEAMTRFRAEAEAAASLEHEGILPIYAVGEHDGAPFYSMKFAEGGTLSAQIENYSDKPREAAALVAKLARAVAFAHEHRILHRDLKPGNVLFDSVGKPYVSDFGLAKWLARESDLTQTFAVLGTPFYMAPEQAISSNLVTEAADIYSLGAILYHLLTGHPPFSGDTPMEVLRRAAEELPQRLRLANRSIPRDLETVCLKCLEKDPEWRYSSAAALADDLDSFCAGRPIQARRAELITRAGKWVRRNPTSALLAASVVALAAAVGWNIWKSELVRHPVTTGIAVLPFENLSDDKEHAFFADGVQDDILTKLAKIADLKVISRTSVMQYRGKQNVREIGDALRVSHVLEGSVRRDSARIHLNAQLIDTRTDTHVWAEEYDRDLSDMFAIQSEIAQKVAQQLHARISAAEKLAIASKPTADLTAFDLYTRANNLLLRTTFNTTQRADLLQAADLLNQAVARDPAFFDAYCQLAYTHDWLYFSGLDHTSARLALAEAAIEAASRLRPDAGETHLARAQNFYWGHLDYDGALAELEAARRTLPKDPRMFELTAYIQRRQGRWEEATRNLEHAIELDPRNINILQETALNYDSLRRYAEEKSLLDRALVLMPNAVNTKAARANVEGSWKADLRPLHQLIDSIRTTNPAALPTIADYWFYLALAERDAAAAQDALIASGPNPVSSYDGVQFNHPFVEGIIARMLKDDAKGRSAFTVARAEQEKIVQAQPNYGPALCVLGLIDAGLGRKEDALREGRRAVELVPVEKDAIRGIAMVKYLAMIAAWVGDNDLACEQLASIIHRPSELNYGDLKLLPLWDPLRGDPRFERLMEEAKQPVALTGSGSDTNQHSVEQLPHRPLSN